MKSVLFGVAVLLSSTAQAAETGLADRLGGYAKITSLVGEFLNNVAKDDRINQFFARTDLPRLRKLLADQICTAGQGFLDAKRTKPCTYAGYDMKTIHKGMGVEGTHFDAMVEDLRTAMNAKKHKVPEKEQKELIALLADMRKDIVAEVKKPEASPAAHQN